LEDYHPPVADQLENYLSNSLMKDDKDDDEEVGRGSMSRPAATGTAKLAC
jgi:hypothetical protein